MNRTQHNRVLCAAHMMVQLDVIRDRAGCTSYELADYLGCTPQTVTNNLLRHGKRFGITYEEEVHRTLSDGSVITKRLWSVDTESPRWHFWRHVAKNSYQDFMNQKVGE